MLCVNLKNILRAFYLPATNKVLQKKVRRIL